MFDQLIGSWWALILLGICAGTVSGTLGIGSGIIMVPSLVLFFAINQKSAQGMSLAIMIPMAITGAIRYKLNPDIDVHMGTVILVAVGAIVGALIGSEIVRHVPCHILRKVFSVFLVIVAIRMFLVSTPPSQKKPGETPPPNVDETSTVQDE